jgi:hypothetical protein
MFPLRDPVWDEGVIYRKEWALWHREQAHFTS